MPIMGSAGRLLGGRYRIVERIGRGGMGEVFMAEDEVLGRRVAVKHIVSTEEDRITATQRLLREARSAGRIHHPNVVTVHDLVVEEQDAYIVMEYVAAEDLAQILRRGAISPERAARIGAQVADALAAAHALGIVHRDVKPSNILISTGDAAKLADFGVARVAGDTGLTRAGHMIGSVAYMAPEVARGADANAAADLFSLGATLFAAVEGRPPFASDDDSSTSVAMLARLVTQSAPPATRAGPLADVLAGLLSSMPEGRPTAAMVAHMLRAAFTGPAQEAPAGSAPIVVDDEALIETRLRPAGLPAGPQPGNDIASEVRPPTATFVVRDEVDRTRRRPAPEPAAEAEPSLPMRDGSTTDTPPKSAPKAESAPPPQPKGAPAQNDALRVLASSTSATLPKSKPLTPNQIRDRRRRRLMSVAVIALTVTIIVGAFALLRMNPAPSADPVRTPLGAPAVFSLSTYTGSASRSCSADSVKGAANLMGFAARAAEGVLTVKATVQGKLTSTSRIWVRLDTDENVDPNLLVIYDASAEDITKGKSVLVFFSKDGTARWEWEGADIATTVSGDTITWQIPLARTKAKQPLSVGLVSDNTDGESVDYCPDDGTLEPID